MISGKANDWRNRQHVVLDLFQTENVQEPVLTFGEPLKHVITLRGHIFGELCCVVCCLVCCVTLKKTHHNNNHNNTRRQKDKTKDKIR